MSDQIIIKKLVESWLDLPNFSRRHTRVKFPSGEFRKVEYINLHRDMEKATLFDRHQGSSGGEILDVKFNQRIEYSYVTVKVMSAWKCERCGNVYSKEECLIHPTPAEVERVLNRPHIKGCEMHKCDDHVEAYGGLHSEEEKSARCTRSG
jgi:hypothetical protein